MPAPAGQETTAPCIEGDKGPIGSEGIAFFENKVRPILAEHCYRCHGPDSGAGKAELRVDALDALLKGGVSGPAIVRGEPGRSLLILAVRHEGDVSMPPKKKLPAAEIDALTAWVEDGSSVARRPPRSRTTDGRDTPAPSPNGPSRPGGSGRSGCRRTHRRRPSRGMRWSLIPHRSVRPGPARGRWAASGAVRPTRGRSCAAPTLDLLGIPPTVEEMDAFLRDDSPRAFECVIDRLLASPRYGERWGRHWLDVVRYADSNGMDDNLAYSEAWRYRDYYAGN